MFRLWKKKRHEMPTEAICRNCGTQTIGRHCHVCGQSVFAGQEQPILQFISNLLENAFALDGKVLLTLRRLLFKPGFLSAEYRLGRIVRYVLPVKLFWMSSLIFFALLFSQDLNTNENASEQKGETLEQTTTSTAGNATITDVENIATPVKEAEKQERKHNVRIMEIKVGDTEANVPAEQVRNYFKTYAPYVTFLFIPIFALLLQLLFWRKKYFYISHLVFAVHFHAFLWVMCSLLLISDILLPNFEFHKLLNLNFFFLPGLYLMFAIYRFYQPKRKWTAIWKAVVVTLLYVILIIAFLVGVSLLVVKILGIEG
jgi:hypothetical protein